MNPNEDRGELGGFPNRENDKHTKSVFNRPTPSVEETENTNPAPEVLEKESASNNVADEAVLEKSKKSVEPETIIEEMANGDPTQQNKIVGERAE